MDYRETIYTTQWKIQPKLKHTRKKVKWEGGGMRISWRSDLLWVVEKVPATRGLGVPVDTRIGRELHPDGERLSVPLVFNVNLLNDEHDLQKKNHGNFDEWLMTI